MLKESARDLILGASILFHPAQSAVLRAGGAARSDRPNWRPNPDLPRPAPEPTSLQAAMPCLVGYGRVGRLIAAGLKGALPLLVIEEGTMGEPGLEHIQGNGARDDVLEGFQPSRPPPCSLSPFPEAAEAGQIVEKARRANPALMIVARAHFDAEVEHPCWPMAPTRW